MMIITSTMTGAMNTIRSDMKDSMERDGDHAGTIPRRIMMQKSQDWNLSYRRLRNQPRRRLRRRQTRRQTRRRQKRRGLMNMKPSSVSITTAANMGKHTLISIIPTSTDTTAGIQNTMEKLIITTHTMDMDHSVIKDTTHIMVKATMEIGKTTTEQVGTATM